ncbi:MAG: MarR family winged helix-turn-helix transcriptional regulator [Thermodesulfobacteriota bacterium]|nr:MarR family winged helix-turn-helix transcriptional regulator [Thermodesulfobacteriota bacterium]
MNLKIRQVRENSFGWLVKMLSQKIDTIMESGLRSIGLTRGIFATLMMLSEQEGVNQTELGNAIGIPGYATTRTLDTLEEMGLVKRCPDPNSRRAHRIYLTNEGKALVKKLPPLVQRVNSDFLSALKEEERQQLIETMKKVLHSNRKVSILDPSTSSGRRR